MEDQKVAPLDSPAKAAAAPTMHDLPTIPDPPAAVPGPAPAGEGADEPRAGITRLGDPVAVWPCAGCGRPVPQPAHGARTVRYCQDEDGGCERAAREARARAWESPGLTGQVAWAWEMVERLEDAAGRLAGSLASELGVAGVERRVADARADAAGHVAIAQRERDASQRQAEAAWRETATARARADTAEQDAARARAAAERAAAERDTARRERDDAKDAADAAAAARLAAESERDRVAGREGELRAALEAARGELVTLHERVAEAEGLAQSRGGELAIAGRTADDLRAAVRDAEAQRGQAVADRDQVQARAHDLEQQNWRLARTVDDLRAAVRALTAERDAARAEADRARRRVDALTRVAEGGGPHTAIDREPPTGVHSLTPLTAMTGDPLGLDGHRSGRNGFRLPHTG
ncbi:hypothetical protein [Spirillospora albida]|uniref:hypothetical protein n=1 Tax=Spirillospora albida TaxID=58123 RepID=UPI00068CB0B6|nr:hypothetical protein [Spirillospora albida]